jgi:hypothetical protein
MRAGWRLTVGAVLLLAGCAEPKTDSRGGLDPQARPQWTQAVVSGVWLIAAGTHVMEQRCRRLDEAQRDVLARDYAEMMAAIAAEVYDPWYREGWEKGLAQFAAVPCEHYTPAAAEWGSAYARSLASELRGERAPSGR